MKSIYIYISLFISVFTMGYCQTLDDYLTTAAENNPGLQASYTRFEAALQRTARAKALPDPTLSFGVFISPVETRVGPQRARFSLSQMFPWFGTLKAKKDVAALQAEAQYEQFLITKNELFFKVKKAYYPIYEIRQQLKWQQENLNILESYHQLATTAFSNNKGTLADVIRTEIMMDEVKINIKLLEDKLKPFAISFNRLLNRPDSLEVMTEDSLVVSPLMNNYSKDSLFIHPEISKLDKELEVFEAQEVLAKKKGLPQFGVGLDYVIVGQRTDLPAGQAGMDVPDNGKDILMPMATVSLPIFRGKYKAATKEAQLMQTAVSQQKLEVENDLTSQYYSAHYALKKALELITLYDQQIEKSKQIERLLKAAYSNSGKDFEEVLRIQQQLIRYQLAKVTAVKEYYLALAQLDFITSKTE